MAPRFSESPISRLEAMLSDTVHRHTQDYPESNICLSQLHYEPQADSIGVQQALMCLGRRTQHGLSSRPARSMCSKISGCSILLLQYNTTLAFGDRLSKFAKLNIWPVELKFTIFNKLFDSVSFDQRGISKIKKALILVSTCRGSRRFHQPKQWLKEQKWK